MKAGLTFIKFEEREILKVDMVCAFFTSFFKNIMSDCSLTYLFTFKIAFGYQKNL